MVRLNKTAKKLLIIMTLLGGQTIFGTPVFGVTEASISINISSSLTLSLMPGAFGATSQSVSVTTDNYTGYTAQLTNPTNSTDLVNVGDNTKTIPTIILPQGSSFITQSQFTSGYGFSTDGTNYVPAPTSSSNILLGQRNSSGTSSHNLYFGALSGADTAPGTYTKDFVITVVANNPQYSITYNANAGTDTVTGMPSNIAITPSSTGTVTLSSDIPSRSDYVFLGWDTNSLATIPTYPKTNTNIIDLEPTQSNALNLYAIWEYSPPPVIADYSETFAEATGPTASVTTNLTSGGSGMSPSEYITKIFAYTNNTGRTISSITVEIVYSKANQGATSGSLIGKLNINGIEYSASPVSVARNKVTNQHLSLAQFDNLNIPSSSDVSFTIGTDSDAFTAGITISSQTVTVTFAD
ncbi:InlB B-repeat-containing protein [Candidatus Saccharibacteria bacterium]|nr:InlB B-repeat-containing protein [Candidatus Saccharibacteria bacterium]